MDSSKNEKFYITTAIAYATNKPHIGNTYDSIFTDVVARFKKMQGFDVLFCTGADEHGQKIEELAKSKSINPKDHVDEISQKIKGICDLMNCSYDIFIRTTDNFHVKAVQKMFRKLYESGDIYKSKYEGWFCVPCESFFTNSQLVEGSCPDCGREVKKVAEDAYFFKASKYGERLKEHFEQNKDFIVPSFFADELINNFIKPGVQDFCVSRSSVKWGIPIDFDPEHTIYVWLDALPNYITALGYDGDNETSSERFNKFWPADLHVIGKDILRFHAIYWPMILMALGLKVPNKIFAHQWLLSGNGKMSKSIGNVMYADELANFFSVDSVRFYLLISMPISHDGNVSYESFIEIYNSELANTLGNLVKRSCDMALKYFDGKLSKPKNFEEKIKKFGNLAECCSKQYLKFMEEFRISDAIGTVMDFSRSCNKYIDETTPWVLAKDEKNTDMLELVLYNLLEGIRFLAIMLSPMIPKTAEKILGQLGNLTCDLNSIEKFGELNLNFEINESEVLFKRIDKEEKLKEIEAYFSSRE